MTRTNSKRNFNIFKAVATKVTNPSTVWMNRNIAVQLDHCKQRALHTKIILKGGLTKIHLNSSLRDLVFKSHGTDLFSSGYLFNCISG